MSYKILSCDTIEEYLSTIATVKSYFNGARLEIGEIGDGNLNFVYIIKSSADPHRALILKQAVPYLRCAGKEYALSRERMSYEIRALKIYNSLTPALVPKIYHSDEDMSLVIMEYLNECVILREGLFKQHRYNNLTDQITTFLATTLFKTSSLYLNSEDKRALMDKFNTNTQLCKLTEDFVFTTAFMAHETNQIDPSREAQAKMLFEDTEFKQKILELKYIFMTHSDALLHGDLHTGSIMVDHNSSYIIDPEFAFVGPFGFDLGALIANMINMYISSLVRGVDSDYQEYILDSIIAIYKQFDSKFLDLWNQQHNSALIDEKFLSSEDLDEFKSRFMRDIFTQSIGFAGAKIARRVFGIAGVEEIRNLKSSLRERAEDMALSIARVMVVDEIYTVDELTDLLRSYSEI